MVRITVMRDQAPANVANYFSDPAAITFIATSLLESIR